MTLRVGDSVIYQGEAGTIVHLEPTIFTPDAFHSYVPVLGTARKTGQVEVPVRAPNAGVVERIREWLARQAHDARSP